MDPQGMTQSVAKYDTTITIPATGTRTQISELLAAAVKAALGITQTVPVTRRTVVGGKIMPAGAAYKWSMSSAATLVPVAADEAMEEPASDFLDTYVESDGGAIASVVVVLYLAR
jgi:hypothetical protein